MADYFGTPGDDTHTGTADADNIFGQGGNDTLNGEGGNDLINGGIGHDDISGGDDHDRLIGFDGDDIIDGDDGDDYITGGLGDDFISGGDGFDRAGYYHQDAGLGGVTISLLLIGAQATGSQGIDTLAGIEHLSGTPFGDSLTGDDGDNWLWGSAATLLDGVTVSATNHDFIDGQGGDDLITVGIGNHTLHGGTHTIGWGDTLRFTENGATESLLSISLFLQSGSAQVTGNGSWTITGFENVVGGEVDDFLIGDHNANVLAGDSGSDNLFGNGGDDTLLGDGYIDPDTDDTGFSGPITAFTLGDGDDSAPDGDDFLIGGAGADLIAGGGGHDRLIGGLDNDELHGGDGDDDLRGSNTSGTPVGGGDDELNGDAGFDRVGYYHTDQASGGVTVSLLLQGAAQNTGSQGMDTLNGIEHLSGTPYADILTGDDGDNWLWGSPATLSDGVTVSTDNNDTLNGGGGDDLLVAGIGNHNLDGGDDIDTVRFTENGNPESALTLSLAFQGAAQASGNGSWTLTGIENVSGGQQDDAITGDDNANLLAGEGGDDTLIGGLGADTLLGDGSVNVDTHGIGGSGPIVTIDDISEAGDPGGLDHLDGGEGADTMRGGFGDDYYVVDDAGDATIENEDEGEDTVQTALASYTLAANVENLNGAETAQTLTGNGEDNGIYGGDGFDTLNGLGGNDYLVGYFGADTLVGGLGDDVYIDWDGLDTITEAAGQGVDEVQTRALSYTLTAHVENLTGILNLDQELTGNALNNFIRGGLGNDELNGEQGNDTLFGDSGDDEMNGGAGNDVYFVFQAGDVVNENPGEGTDEVRTILPFYTLGANFENLTGGTPDDQRLEGNALNNVILANAGDDQLFGHGGDDHLDPRAPGDEMYGGLGDDTFVVYSSDFDTVVELAGEGTDKVLSSVTLTLMSEVENLTLTGDSAIDGTGNELANALVGNGAANRLDGAGGADLMTGGGGDDVFIVDEVGDKVFESVAGGTDQVESSVTFVLGGNIENLVLTGFAAINATGNTLSNILTGNDAANTLNGGAAEDLMTGGLGNDTYIVDSVSDQTIEAAEAGLDTVLSSIGHNLAAEIENLVLTGLADLWGGGNGLDNRLTGNAGANLLEGYSGNDTLDGAAGADTLKGGLNDDTYIVDNAGDTVVEGVGVLSGADTVLSSVTHTLAVNVENLTLTGAAAIDGTGNGAANLLTGNGAANILRGLDGHDTLDGGLGGDTMEGGIGNDNYVVDNVGDVVTEAAAAGSDTVRSAITYTLTAEVENLILTGRNPINGTGNGLANFLTGNAAINLLDGGVGADTMTGGGGNDSYVVDNVGDRVVETAGGGTDLVRSSIGYTLGLEVENLTLTGAAAISGTGNSLANTLTGNDAANLLNGGTGADKMFGGLGNDVYVVDNAGDVVGEAAGAGTDTVQSSVGCILGANVENLTLTGAAAINGTGNTLANTLIGNNAANVLNGGGGADSMKGGLGDDVYIVDNAGDAVSEGPGAGTDRVESSVTHILAANVENLTLTGLAAINGTGNTLANTLLGNNAANILNGGTGGDVMKGGLGNDVYVVDNAGDLVSETATAGTDRVESSIAYTLGAHLENLTLTGAAAVGGTGNTLANVLIGNGAANTLNGGSGADSMAGGLGNDVYVVDNIGDTIAEAAAAGTDSVQSSVTHILAAEVENLTLTGALAINGTGNGLANTVTGNGFGNTLAGLGGGDTLDGGGSSDRIHGGLGNDNLKGGTGADGFYFDTALNAATNVDKILDFVVADDTIFLNRAVFAGIAANGTLAAAAFVAGTSAADASDRIVYDSATGRIYYDSDGLGGAAQILFAQVTAGTALTHLDFNAFP